MTVITTDNPQQLGSSVNPLELTDLGVRLLDQTRLPHEETYVLIETEEAMADAIRTMIVRGAPAIGIAGAYGLVLSAREFVKTLANSEAVGSVVSETVAVKQLFQHLEYAATRLDATRPTAVNLSWALREMKRVLELKPLSLGEALTRLTEKAVQIHREDIAACVAIGRFGAVLAREVCPQGSARILTHCNAGALATGGYGTALGVVRAAFAEDSTVTVFADETRPRLQGARLTTWELVKDNIPVTLLTDGMAASLMRQGRIDFVVVGADRIAANGDVVNKIGTYPLAIAAKAHGIPFYVAAPCSTIDINTPDGKSVEIEERGHSEVERLNGERLCAEGTMLINPAFDVTPASYVTAIITEKSVLKDDYASGISALFA